jgi:DNA-binding NarL/FixJ family response regulator
VPVSARSATAPAAAPGPTEAPWRLFTSPDHGLDAAARSIRRRIRVVVCHQAAAVRTGVQRVLDATDDIDVVATAADAEDGVEATTLLQPDIVLTDLCMPHVDGIAAARRIGARAPRSHVLIFTASAYPHRLRDARDAGAVGFVLKDATPAELRCAIRAAADCS